WICSKLFERYREQIGFARSCSSATASKLDLLEVVRALPRANWICSKLIEHYCEKRRMRAISCQCAAFIGLEFFSSSGPVGLRRFRAAQPRVLLWDFGLDEFRK